MIRGGLAATESRGGLAGRDGNPLALSQGDDHGLLGGLGDDDHTIYALLAGRAGGQTVKGDTASGGSLTLMSTAHATKGSILLGSSVYDEANNKLGIGGTPTHVLDVVKALAGADLVGAVRNTSNTASAQAKILAEVAGGTAADAFFQAVVSGVTTWSWGVDNSDSDAWKLSPNADIGTSPSITVSTAGGVGIGGAPASGRLLTINSPAGNPYVRIIKNAATAGTWDFGQGASIVSGDNHFCIADQTSGFAGRLYIMGTSSSAVTGDVVIGTPASATVPTVLATNATKGLLRITTCAGTPTGAATDGSIMIDTTNHKFYFMSGGTWRDAGP